MFDPSRQIASFMTDLEGEFVKGFATFLNSFQGAPGAGVADTQSGHTRSVTFWVGTAGHTQQWTVDVDCFIVGVCLPPSSCFAFVPYVYGTAPAPGAGTDRVFFDTLFVASASSGLFSLGATKFPLFKDQKIYFGPTNPNSGALILQNA